MANLNKKQGQGKTPEQYRDSSRLAWYGVVGMIIILILMSLLSSCTGVYYLSDSEYSSVRESHASPTYHNNLVYWGWDNGYYYYYGTPHYYPWYYYYNTCPPFNYNTTTHVIINRPVKKPTHRPNHRPKSDNCCNGNMENPKTNTNRNNKVIIKTNNGSKRTNKTTIRRKPKK